MIGKSSLIAVLVASLALSLVAEPASAGVSTLSQGTSGSRVVALQRALDRAGYLAGPPDGRFGDATEQAVVAYQKVHGLDRTGVATIGEYKAILHTTRLALPLEKPQHYVYVDLSRQVLFEVHGGVVRQIIPVSTGGGYTFPSKYGATEVATTPTGRFSIYRKVTGWYHSFLGWMYYPSYFTDGYAIHGDTYVPSFPVSHGCIRIPMWDAVSFFDRNPVGTPVFVEQ